MKNLSSVRPFVRPISLLFAVQIAAATSFLLVPLLALHFAGAWLLFHVWDRYSVHASACASDISTCRCSNSIDEPLPFFISSRSTSCPSLRNIMVIVLGIGALIRPCVQMYIRLSMPVSVQTSVKTPPSFRLVSPPITFILQE